MGKEVPTKQQKKRRRKDIENGGFQVGGGAEQRMLIWVDWTLMNQERAPRGAKKRANHRNQRTKKVWGQKKTKLGEEKGSQTGWIWKQQGGPWQIEKTKGVWGDRQENPGPLKVGGASKKKLAGNGVDKSGDGRKPIGRTDKWGAVESTLVTRKRKKSIEGGGGCREGVKKGKKGLVGFVDDIHGGKIRRTWEGGNAKKGEKVMGFK